MSLKLHHVGIVVSDILEVARFYKDSFGLDIGDIYDIEAYNAKVAFIPVGDANIELVQPTNPEDGLGRFLKRGGGLHHVCYQVLGEIEEVVENFKKKGLLPVHEGFTSNPVFKEVTFLHPKYTKKVLIELVTLW